MFLEFFFLKFIYQHYFCGVAGVTASLSCLKLCRGLDMRSKFDANFKLKFASDITEVIAR